MKIAKQLLFVLGIFSFGAQATDVAILPMKRILESAKLHREEREREAREQGVFQEKSQGPHRTKRVYEVTPEGIVTTYPYPEKAYEVFPTHEDWQKEVDMNDGRDITDHEEIGYSLSVDHLKSFSLCVESRIEKGVCNKNTYWMTVLSSVAYLKYSLAAQYLQNMGFTKVTFIEGISDSQLFIAKKEPQKDADGNILWNTGLTVISFRGSDKPVDWLTNLKTTTVDISGHENEAWVHEGFAEALDEVYPNILEALDLANDHSPLFITGHSLGGALGMQLAIRLVARESENSLPLIAEKSNQLRGIYTFAIPRVGNSWARKIIDHYMNVNRSFEVAFQNHSDPITKLPFDWWGFKRFGLQVILPQKAQSVADMADHRNWQCFADIGYKGPSVFTWDFMDNDIGAHFFTRYVKYFMSYRDDGSLSADCNDSEELLGPRYEEKQGFRSLQTPSGDGRACDYTAYTWGGNIQ